MTLRDEYEYLKSELMVELADAILIFRLTLKFQKKKKTDILSVAFKQGLLPKNP